MSVVRPEPGSRYRKTWEYVQIQIVYNYRNLCNTQPLTGVVECPHPSIFCARHELLALPLVMRGMRVFHLVCEAIVRAVL